MPPVTIVLATHNPHAERLRRTLVALDRQTLPAAERELLVVDNASTDALAARDVSANYHGYMRVLREERLGLTAARLRGFAEAQGEAIVLVDDDNVLAPDYLARALAYLQTKATVGAIGGKSLPEFESAPAGWVAEFAGLLALRDLGDTPLQATWSASEASRQYPVCSPIGAGMVLRRRSAEVYARALDSNRTRAALDRTGAQLTSGGDNDLVMSVLEAGFAVAYFPELQLTHLIPARRIERDYLGALNRAIMRSWVRVLDLHGIRPWRAVRRASVPLRKARAWLRTRAWAGPAEWVRWQGRCGQFEGQAEIGNAGHASREAGARP